MRSRILVGLLVGSCFATLPAFAAATETYNGHEVAAGQVILKLGSVSPAIQQALKQLGDADDFRQLSSTLNLFVLHSRSGKVNALMNILKSHPSVALVEPDYVVRTTAVPNDAQFAQQWDFLNTATVGADIGATAAWGVTTGSTANVVGVVDTGFDYTHPDLAANIWSAPTSFTVKLSWGTLTCPAGSHGYNAIAHTCDPMDDVGHGTHVSGTIGAVGNNGLGVAGVNWTTRIMGLRFINSSGGLTSDAIDAMEFALQAKTIFGGAANVRVLSNSWGGSGASSSLLNEINKVGSSDILFVVAAGNSSQNIEATPTYPAAFNTANMISVAATTQTDGLASFSNYGPNAVHLGAPGVNILSTVPGGYAYYNGTSMATPHVSGAAMLVLSACSLNTAALKSTILSTTDPVAGLSGLVATSGRLNVNKAIRSCASTTVAPPPSSGSAAFVKTDYSTAGNWTTNYGADGYSIASNSDRFPSYAAVSMSGNSSYVWLNSTTDSRAPLKAGSTTDRIAACWYSGGVFYVDLNLTDSATHQVAFYMVDWDGYNGGRSQRVDILDTNSNVLDTRSISNFGGGAYLVWNLKGHVIARFTNLNPSSNALVQGIFFGGAPAALPATGTASFVKSDASTSGNWKGVYGSAGYSVVADSSSLPSFVTVTPSGNSSWVWVASTTDARALLKGASTTDRIASCWYSYSSFNVDLNFKDTAAHQVAIYMVDYDNYFGRTQRVDVVDANNNVLDTRSISGYYGGTYLVWNLSGHVALRFTSTNPQSNAVVSGLFFQ